MKIYFLFVIAFLASSFASAASLKASFCTDSGSLISKTTPANAYFYNNAYARIVYGWDDKELNTTYRMYINVNMDDVEKKIDRYGVYFQKVKTEGTQKTLWLNYTGIDNDGKVRSSSQNTQYAVGAAQTDVIEVGPGKTLERTIQNAGGDIVAQGIPMTIVWRTTVCEHDMLEEMSYHDILTDQVAKFAGQLDSLFVSNRAQFQSTFDGRFDAKSTLYKLWKSELPPPSSSSSGSDSDSDSDRRSVDEKIREKQRARERRDNIDRLAEKIAEEIAKRRGKH